MQCLARTIYDRRTVGKGLLAGINNCDQLVTFLYPKLSKSELEPVKHRPIALVDRKYFTCRIRKSYPRGGGSGSLGVVPEGQASGCSFGDSCHDQPK